MAMWLQLFTAQKESLHPDCAIQKASGKLLYRSRILSSLPSECQMLSCLGEGDQRKLFQKFSGTEKKHEELMKKLGTQEVNPYK